MKKTYVKPRLEMQGDLQAMTSLDFCWSVLADGLTVPVPCDP